MASVKIRKRKRPTRVVEVVPPEHSESRALTPQQGDSAFQRYDIQNARRRLKIGRWASMTDTSLVDRMMRMQQNEVNIRDLEPDIALMRTLIADFIERYETFADALLAWYQDKDPAQKPRKIIDISDAVRLIDMTSRVVERMHRMEAEGSISMETFHILLEKIGIVVATQVKDITVLARIQEQWQNIVVDQRKKVETLDVTPEGPHVE